MVCPAEGLRRPIRFDRSRARRIFGESGALGATAMCNPFLPTALLLVLPLAYFAHRAGALRSASVRWICGGLLLGITALEFPVQGLGEPYLGYLKMLISGGMVSLMLVRDRLVATREVKRRYLALLVGVAVTSASVNWNFFAFHGNHTLIHYSEFAHYYLGSKYFPELGYGSLYTAMLEAEHETTGTLSVSQARDLMTNRIVPAVDLLGRALAIKAQFTPKRWAEFVADANYFRQYLGPLYATTVTDHGYNPSPVWTLIGGTIANHVPSTSLGIRSLASLDILLEVIAFGAIASAFGLEVMLLAVTYFCVIFGASFDWIGGAYLRYMWFCSLVLAACALKCGRRGLAGALLAASSALRVFPVFFAVGMAFKAISAPEGNGGERSGAVRFVGAFALTILGLIVLSGISTGGVSAWAQFVRNISTHSESLSSNFVGLTNPMLYALEAIGVIPDDVAALLEWRHRLYAFQGVILLPLGAWMVWRARGRLTEVDALAVGGLLIAIGVNLAAYYFSFLVVVLLSRSKTAAYVGMMFLAEFLVYYLQLFEEHPVVLYWYRGAIMVYLFAALFFDDLFTMAMRHGGDSLESWKQRQRCS